MNAPIRVAGGLVCTILLVQSAAWAVDPATDQYNFATGLFTSGRYKLAVEEYRAFLTKYPTHAKAGDAQFFLAQSCFHLKDYTKTLEAYRATVSKHASNKHIAEARYGVGECLVLLKRHKEAVPALRAYLSAHAKHALCEYALCRLGDSLLHERQYAEGRQGLHAAGGRVAPERPAHGLHVQPGRMPLRPGRLREGGVGV